MERPIITIERYEKLKRLMHGSDDDIKMVANIINECNIDKSLLYILALIPQKYVERNTFSTPLSQSPRLYVYLTRKAMGVTYDLDTLVGIWQIHCEENEINQTAGIKFLAKEYIAKPLGSKRKAAVILNPKTKRYE